MKESRERYPLSAAGSLVEMSLLAETGSTLEAYESAQNRWRNPCNEVALDNKPLGFLIGIGANRAGIACQAWVIDRGMLYVHPRDLEDT